MALPLLGPGLASIAIFNLAAYWSEFALALVLLDSQARFTIPVGLFSFQSGYETEWQLVAAASFIGFVPVIAPSFCCSASSSPASPRARSRAENRLPGGHMSPLHRRAALLSVLALLAGPHLRPAAGQRVAPEVPTRAERARTERKTFLDMYARAYFPGRSGQIMVVPREGEILTRPGADVPFMHGSPWSYDTRIPIVFWGSRYVRPGRLTEAATQQDIAPTIAQAIGLPMPGVTGHALAIALRPGAPPPKAVVLLVLDAFRADYLDKHAAVLPNLTRLRREGASFERARVSHLPTITTVGHSTIATGTDARFHGIVANGSWDRITGKVAEPFARCSPQT